jgi:hypothetical protein
MKNRQCIRSLLLQSTSPPSSGAANGDLERRVRHPRQIQLLRRRSLPNQPGRKNSNSDPSSVRVRRRSLSLSRAVARAIVLAIDEEKKLAMHACIPIEMVIGLEDAGRRSEERRMEIVQGESREDGFKVETDPTRSNFGRTSG